MQCTQYLIHVYEKKRGIKIYLIYYQTNSEINARMKLIYSRWGELQNDYLA